MKTVQRPLSPHLQVYRPQLTSVLSITHRGTGVVLSAGALVLLYWLVALASGPEAYAGAQRLLGSWPGQIVLLGFTFSLYYHLCNGIRHLGWDLGLGLDLPTAYASGWAVVACSVGMTVVTWAVVLVAGGAR